MATYYVWSGATGSATGADWTNAFTTFAAGEAAATSSGDIIKVHVGHAENVVNDTTYTIDASIFVLCVDKDNSDALAVQNGTTQYIGHNTSNRSITLTTSGVYDVYIYGLAFLKSGSSIDNFNLGVSSGDQFIFDNCKFLLNGSGATDWIAVGSSTGGNPITVTFRNCTFNFGAAGQKFLFRCATVYFYSCTTTGVSNTELFDNGSDNAGTTTAYACDFSHCSGNLVGDHTSGPRQYIFAQCKLHASVSILAAQTVAAKHVEVFLYDCSSTTVHYAFGYYNAAGQVTSDAAVYVTADGAEYNTTGNKHSWKIVGTTVATKQAPFLTPWISVHNETLSAQTPYIEALRSGSTTKYTDAQLWSEWMYKATTSTLGTLVNDRTSDVTGAGSDQAASSLTASDWTGEDVSNNAFMKLESGSITPGAIGDISVRVGVVGAITVYIDPQIRGLS